MKETKLVGANYILTFYNDINMLNHEYSIYINLLSELKAKHVSIDHGVDDENKGKLVTALQKIRYYVSKTYVEYRAIFKNVDKLEEDPELKKLYASIFDNFVVRKEDITNYVSILNTALVSDVIKSLLVTSSDIVSNIYDNS